MYGFFRFLSLFSVLSIIILGIVYQALLNWAGRFSPDINTYIFVCLFFYVLTNISYYLIMDSVNKSPESFVRNFIAVIAAKLFVSFLVILGSVFIFKGSEVQIIISFLAAYLVNSALETSFLIKNIKNF